MKIQTEHRHRRPMKRDFEGKTIKRFQRSADNVYRFWFTDGSAFAIQSELFHGLPLMEICEVCVKQPRSPPPSTQTWPE